jgi:hypothetical protein
MDFFLTPVTSLLGAILKAINRIPSSVNAINTAAAQAHQDAVVAEGQRDAIAKLLEDIQFLLTPPPPDAVAGFGPTIDTIEKQ